VRSPFSFVCTLQFMRKFPGCPTRELLKPAYRCRLIDRLNLPARPLHTSPDQRYRTTPISTGTRPCWMCCLTPALGRWGLRVVIILRFLLPHGAVRAFETSSYGTWANTGEWLTRCAGRGPQPVQSLSFQVLRSPSFGSFRH
jgi:hypothetical protein